MGSGASKKKQVVRKTAEPEDIYEKVLRQEKPIGVEDFQVSSEGINIQKVGVSGPVHLVDQGLGCPIILELPSFKRTTINFPINPGARCVLTNPSTLLIVSKLDLTLLNTLTFKQTKYPPMILPREHFSLCFYQEKLIITGGSNLNDLNSCEMFDGNLWENVAPLNIARSWHSSVVSDGRVYVVGGVRANSIERLQGKWEVLKISLPWNVNRVGLVAFENKLIVVGGEVVGKGYCSAAWELDLQTQRLNNMKTCPVQGLFYSQGACLETRLFFLTSGAIFSYSLHDKSWETYQAL